MLQRAASNAYSWWWASHIRTKQSKWLEQCLQDMEEKVQSMLKLIEEDGDSFAKRAEMYYKRRPELISTVEESFKAFRSLADRYDILSKELQNANETIAKVFPEQVQFAMSEDDDCPIPDIPKNVQMPEINNSNVPQVPKAPKKDLKSIITKASKQLQAKKPKKAQKPEVEKSGLTKDEALKEINKIQKDILALQTVKEFVKSSYESGLAKYWGIENQIMELQQKVSRLQDEFDMDTVIEDDEARALMAEAALRSCQETLAMLQEKQEKATREAKEEYKRIEIACRRLQSLRERYLSGQINESSTSEGDNESEFEVSSINDMADLLRESTEIEISPEKTKESLDLTNLTVTQLAEKIDQLVNKVIGLETAVSSQTVLVNTLRTETDDLNAQIKSLEEENENMIDNNHNLSNRVKEMEGKLNKIQGLNKNVESQNSNLQTNFAEARSNLDCLSEKLSSVKPDEEPEGKEKSDSSHQEEVKKDRKDLPSAKETVDVKEVKEVKEDAQVSNQSVTSREEVNKPIINSGTVSDQKPKEKHVNEDHFYDRVNSEKAEKIESDDDMNWQQMLLSGMEDREKILLKEYTTILRNYKDIKRKLSEMEKKEKDCQFDTILQVRDLKEAIQNKDEEIQNLRQTLVSVQGEEKHEKIHTTQPRKPETQNEVNDDVKHTAIKNSISVKNEDEDDDENEDKLIIMDRTLSISKVEEKLRSNIDAILDENLDFWLRFSTEFHQIQKFKTEVQDLQDEISKLKEKQKPDTAQMKSEVRPIYKHLSEIQRELAVWLEQSTSLKDELKRRFESLCGIQEEITRALREGVEEDEIRFSSHQAAKFQGEVLNMKQENNKVREELGAGLEIVRTLQLQIEKTLRKLDEEFGISAEQSENANRARVPLRSFIFGTKQKKQKQSIFSCMHPGRKYQILRTGIRLSNQNH